MIVHLDLNGDEVLYCDGCDGRKKISDDAWLVIIDEHADEALCKSCYQSLPTSTINGGEL